MAHTVVGLFEDRDNVEKLLDHLDDTGYERDEISVVMKDQREADEIRTDDADGDGTDVVEGATAGATTGAILGGLAGLLSAIAIPGLGAFFIGGPLAAALGLTGTAAATISGAATGALAGGLIGGLMELGLSEEEAEEYETRIKEGSIFVAVPTTKARESEIVDMFNQHDATDIRTVETSTSKLRDVEGIMAKDDEGAGYSYGVKGGKSKRTTRR